MTGSSDPAASVDADAGLTQIGEYQILEKIADGSTAEVLQATLLAPVGAQPAVAIKVLQRRFCGDPSIVQLFLDEARQIAQLSHPNIVGVREVGMAGDRPYAVMELVDGVAVETLGKRVFRKAVSIWPHMTAEIVRQVALALSYVRNHTVAGQPLRLVHHDVRPGNIMVAVCGTVKVLDFGIVKQGAAVRQSQQALATTHRHLALDEIAGTPVDQRNDVYSCGVFFYELLTGRSLSPAGPHGEAAIVPPSQRDPVVPPALDEIVLRALARDPQQRWPSTAALAEAIEGALIQQGWQVSELTYLLSNLATLLSTSTGPVDHDPTIIESITISSAEAFPTIADLEPILLPEPSSPITDDSVSTGTPRQSISGAPASRAGWRKTARRVALAVLLPVVSWAALSGNATKGATAPPAPAQQPTASPPTSATASATVGSAFGGAAGDAPPPAPARADLPNAPAPAANDTANLRGQRADQAPPPDELSETDRPPRPPSGPRHHRRKPKTKLFDPFAD